MLLPTEETNNSMKLEYHSAERRVSRLDHTGNNKPQEDQRKTSAWHGAAHNNEQQYSLWRWRSALVSLLRLHQLKLDSLLCLAHTQPALWLSSAVNTCGRDVSTEVPPPLLPGLSHIFVCLFSCSLRQTLKVFYHFNTCSPRSLRLLLYLLCFKL